MLVYPIIGIMKDAQRQFTEYQIMAFSSEKHGETLTVEQRFEIAASTMSREQLYDLAKRQAVEIAILKDTPWASTDEELKESVKKFGLQYLIDHYQSALQNWNSAIEERNNLRRKLAEVRENARWYPGVTGKKD